MLRIVKVINERNPLGMRVSIAVDSLKNCESIYIFQSNLINELRGMYAGNNTKADIAYRLRIENEFTPNERLLIYKDHRTKGEQIIYIVTKH